jgi:HK97 family phage prohead protease
MELKMSKNRLCASHVNTPILLSNETLENGAFEGYLTVYNTPTRDGRGLYIAKGAFSHQINDINSGNLILPVCLSHDDNDTVGSWKYLEEREIGLWGRGILAIEAKSVKEEVYPKVKSGAYGGLSIGFYTEQATEPKKRDDPYVILKGNLYECSLVPVPAFPSSKITRASSNIGGDIPQYVQTWVDSALSAESGLSKGKFKNLRDYEAGLRDVCSLSNSEAAEVIFHIKRDSRFENIAGLFDSAPEKQAVDAATKARLQKLQSIFG